METIEQEVKEKSEFFKFLTSIVNFLKKTNLEVNVKNDDFSTNIKKNQTGDFNATIGIDNTVAGVTISDGNLKIAYEDTNKKDKDKE